MNANEKMASFLLDLRENLTDLGPLLDEVLSRRRLAGQVADHRELLRVGPPERGADQSFSTASAGVSAIRSGLDRRTWRNRSARLA